MILRRLVRGRRGAHREVLETIQKSRLRAGAIDECGLSDDELQSWPSENRTTRSGCRSLVISGREIDARLGESVPLRTYA